MQFRLLLANWSIRLPPKTNTLVFDRCPYSNFTWWLMVISFYPVTKFYAGMLENYEVTVEFIGKMLNIHLSRPTCWPYHMPSSCCMLKFGTSMLPGFRSCEASCRPLFSSVRCKIWYPMNAYLVLNVRLGSRGYENDLKLC